MRNIMFGDQRDKLAELLNLNVQVLIYHGIFDMIIPISSTLYVVYAWIFVARGREISDVKS